MGYGVAMRTRSYRHMNAEERETLSLGLARGHSLNTMASVLKRAPSTVSRELARNVTRGQPYRACTAHTLATGRACQPRRYSADVGLFKAVRKDDASAEQKREKRKPPQDVRLACFMQSDNGPLKKAEQLRPELSAIADSWVLDVS